MKIRTFSLFESNFLKQIFLIDASNTNLTQQNLLYNNPTQPKQSDQNNFSSSSSGLSFPSYSKNNGINYSQQQSLLQVSKNVVSCNRCEATIPLKHYKLQSSSSSISRSGGGRNISKTLLLLRLLLQPHRFPLPIHQNELQLHHVLVKLLTKPFMIALEIIVISVTLLIQVMK